MDKIFLLSPYTESSMEGHLLSALRSGWVTTQGPQKKLFVDQLNNKFSFKYSCALNSGTAALHLALMTIGLKKGDKVIVSDVSFCAVANVVRYIGGTPVLIDSEYQTWGMCPDLLEEYLEHQPAIKALILVHLYGKPAQVNRIKQICTSRNIVVIEDAAEALGSRVGDRLCGTVADLGVISFNGNKIMTTGGGGLLVSENEAYIAKADFLASQAKSKDHAHYWHAEVGYNYAMSNIAAGVGLGQLELFEIIQENKRKINLRYREALKEWGVFDMLSDTPESQSNHWLNAVLFRRKYADRLNWSDFLQFFEKEQIEIRRFWTPLHVQPAYKHFPVMDRGVGVDLFDRGICLPSGAGLSIAQQEQVIKKLKDYLESRRLLIT